MPKPLLILISGAPASGKTTLARRLASEFGLPVIHKDSIKELLFDTLGWSDRAWSRKIGIASVALMWDFAGRQIAAGGSLVLESNFDPEYDTPTLENLCRMCDVRTVEVHCVADATSLLARFREREKSGQRHPGLRGNASEKETKEFDRLLAEALAGRKWRPISAGTVLTADTSDFEAVDYGLISRFVREAAHE